MTGKAISPQADPGRTELKKMPRGEAVTGGAQCTAAAERRRAGTAKQCARHGDGGAVVRGVGDGQREEIGMW